MTTTQRIFCPLHKNIELSPLICSILNTPEMQRLRDVKQLGATYFVFPSANHSRLEHSLGVCHLAGIMGKNLQKKHPELNITDRFIELLKIAGLIHDIGHGPFSHLYDNYVKHFDEQEHEERGLVIFNGIVKREKIKLTEEEITTIHKMVNPEGRDIYDWKYQIIANKSCQIDVDKIDYILRDSFHLGIPHSGEFKKLLVDVRLNQTRNNSIELVWDSRLQFDIYSLFATRYRLHKKVYTHHTVKGFEYIIIEIMKQLSQHCAASGGLPLSQQPDSIVTQFCYNNNNNPLAINLMSRNHPQLVGELILKDKNFEEPVEKLRIIFDLFVEELKIGFVSGNNKNPLENIYYYKKGKENETPFKIKLSDSSFIIPEKFQERIVRVYKTPESSQSEAEEFWNELIKKYN
jgi:HD superfamily phosphohydrolase